MDTLPPDPGHQANTKADKLARSRKALAEAEAKTGTTPTDLEALARADIDRGGLIGGTEDDLTRKRAERAGRIAEHTRSQDTAAKVEGPTFKATGGKHLQGMAAAAVAGRVWHLMERWWAYRDGDGWRPDDEIGLREITRAEVKEYAAEALGSLLGKAPGDIEQRHIRDVVSACEYVARPAGIAEKIEGNPGELTRMDVSGGKRVPGGVLWADGITVPTGKPADPITFYTVKPSRVWSLTPPLAYEYEALADAGPPVVWDRLMADTAIPAEEVEYLEATAGATLLGVHLPRQVIVLYGDGSTGKSTIASAIVAVVGWRGVASMAGLEGLGQNFATGNLEGKRLLVLNEVERNVKRNRDAIEGVRRLKLITGNDPVVIERKNIQGYEARLGANVLAVGNHAPDWAASGSGDARAMADRIKPIHFANVIARADQNPRLLAELAAERDQLAARFVARYIEWERAGRPEPAHFAELAGRVIAEGLPAAERWADERVTIDPDGRVDRADAVADFLRWHKDNYGDDAPPTERAVTTAIGPKGLGGIRRSGREGVYYVGVKLPDPELL